MFQRTLEVQREDQVDPKEMQRWHLLGFLQCHGCTQQEQGKVQKLGTWTCYNPLGLAASLDVSNVRTQYTIILCFIDLDDRFF
ncbi:hypothetical protein CY35_13G010400 [Sphagnum magellanicum]|nr:hypothetical protein CY35_13G010400 [Sphagnum magellanicum]